MQRTPAGTRPQHGAAAPVGTPFHHLAGPELSLPRLWAATFLGLAGSVAIILIPRFPILSVHWSSDGVPAPPLFGQATPVVSYYTETALALTVLLAVILVIGRSRLSTIVSVTGRVRWSWLGICTLAACAVYTVGGAWTLLFAPADQVPLVRAATAADITIVVALVVLGGVYVAAQELLFRGFFLQIMGEDQPAWAAIPFQALIFTVLYVPGLTALAVIPFQAMFTAIHVPDLTAWGYADMAVYAVAAGWLAIRTGGVEAAIALPLVWNGAYTAIAMLTSRNAEPTRGAIASNWQELIIHAATILVYAAIVRLAAYHRNIATTAASTTD